MQTLLKSLFGAQTVRTPYDTDETRSQRKTIASLWHGSTIGQKVAMFHHQPETFFQFWPQVSEYYNRINYFKRLGHELNGLMVVFLTIEFELLGLS